MTYNWVKIAQSNSSTPQNIQYSDLLDLNPKGRQLINFSINYRTSDIFM